MKQSNVSEYFRPQTLSEALQIYQGYPGVIWAVAGATDVFTSNHLEVEALLDVTHLGLSYVRAQDNEVHIGACTTFAQIIQSQLIQERFTALYQSAKCLADMTTRNMATIGGNICTALPSGDSLPALFVADSRFVVLTGEGEKSFTTDEFFLGPRQTVMQKGYILKEVISCLSSRREASAFEKLGRNSEDLAVVNVAAWLRLNPDDTVAEARIAHGAVAPTVVRSAELEQTLVGKKLAVPALDDYCLAVDKAITPITNIRGSADYRRDCSRVLAKRALLKAYEAAKGAN